MDSIGPTSLRHLARVVHIVRAVRAWSERAGGLHAAGGAVSAGQTSGRTRYAISHSGPARPRRRGFTLLELMITLVVLAIGVLALGQMMPAGSRAMSRSRSKTSGTALAAQKVEDLKALAWTDANLTAGTHTDNSGKYTRTWIITDNTPLAGTKKVAVTVAWTSSTGARSTVLTTYMTQLTN